MTLKPHIGRSLYVLMAIILFFAMSLVLYWGNTPYYTIWAIIGILFALTGLVALTLKVVKPIIRLNDQGFYYYRKSLAVPWSEVSSIKPVTKWGGQSVKWICVYTRNPQKYQNIEKVNKSLDIMKADLLLDFTLATQFGYESVIQYFSKYVKVLESTLDEL